MRDSLVSLGCINYKSKRKRKYHMFIIIIIKVKRKTFFFINNVRVTDIGNEVVKTNNYYTNYYKCIIQI